VTFGDSVGSLTTQVVPVLLYYAIRSNATQQLVPLPTQDGWFGVNDAPNLITTGTGTMPYPACDTTTTGDCWVASVLKYLNYAGVNAGFALSPLQVQTCDIASAGSCIPSPALTVVWTIRSRRRLASIICSVRHRPTRARRTSMATRYVKSMSRIPRSLR
jgi:hypothetical protein